MATKGAGKKGAHFILQIDACSDFHIHMAVIPIFFFAELQFYVVLCLSHGTVLFS